MGLMERLSGSAGDDSVFGRALALRLPRGEAPAGSPDDSARDEPAAASAGDDSSVETARIEPGAAVRALIRELNGRRRYGITTPSHLFSLLHRHLEVTRGALLVPSLEHEYLPIATAGLDRTSAFRLRLSAKELSSLVRESKATIVVGDDRRLFSDRLSRTDFRAGVRIAAFPFYHLRRLVAVLLVFDSPILDMDPSVLDVIDGALSEHAGRLLFDNRQKPLGNRRRAVVLVESQLPDTMKRIRRSAQETDRPIEAVALQLTEFAGVVKDAHPLLDEERLQEDLLDMTALLVSRSHAVVNRGNGEVLVVGLGRETVDSELLIHLITNTLCELFGISRSTKIRSESIALSTLP